MPPNIFYMLICSPLQCGVQVREGSNPRHFVLSDGGTYVNKFAELASVRANRAGTSNGKRSVHTADTKPKGPQRHPVAILLKGSHLPVHFNALEQSLAAAQQYLAQWAILFRTRKQTDAIPAFWNLLDEFAEGAARWSTNQLGVTQNGPPLNWRRVPSFFSMELGQKLLAGEAIHTFPRFPLNPVMTKEMLFAPFPQSGDLPSQPSQKNFKRLHTELMELHKAGECVFADPVDEALFEKVLLISTQMPHVDANDAAYPDGTSTDASLLSVALPSVQHPWLNGALIVVGHPVVRDLRGNWCVDWGRVRRKEVVTSGRQMMHAWRNHDCAMIAFDAAHNEGPVRHAFHLPMTCGPDGKRGNHVAYGTFSSWEVAANLAKRRPDSLLAEQPAGTELQELICQRGLDSWVALRGYDELRNKSQAALERWRLVALHFGDFLVERDVEEPRLVSTSRLDWAPDSKRGDGDTVRALRKKVRRAMPCPRCNTTPTPCACHLLQGKNQRGSVVGNSRLLKIDDDQAASLGTAHVRSNRRALAALLLLGLARGLLPLDKAKKLRCLSSLRLHMTDTHTVNLFMQRVPGVYPTDRIYGRIACVGDRLASLCATAAAQLGIRIFVCYVAVHYDALYWWIACCAAFTALKGSTALTVTGIAAHILGTGTHCIAYFLNGQQTRDFQPGKICEKAGCQAKARFNAAGQLNPAFCWRHKSNGMCDVSINRRLLPRVFGRGGVTAVTRSIRYICSGSKTVVFEGCEFAAQAIGTWGAGVLRSPGAVQYKIEDGKWCGMGHFYAFVVGRHVAISVAEGALGTVQDDNLLPPNDKGTGRVIAKQLDWATALPSRCNVQEWSKAAALAARRLVPDALAELQAEEISCDEDVRCLFAMATELAYVSNGVPIGECCGCDLRWADEHNEQQVPTELQCPYVGSNEGWSLHSERNNWPWLIAAGPGKIRSVRLDLTSEMARQRMLASGSLSASACSSTAERDALDAALQFAKTDAAAAATGDSQTVKSIGKRRRSAT